MWNDVEQATLQLVHVLCSGIVECKDLQRMLSILHDSSSLLLFLETKNICDRNLAENDALFSALHAFAKNARDSNWTPHAVRDIFWNRGYAQFSETLLSVVAPLWLHQLPPGTRQFPLFDCWFEEAPSFALLRAVSAHLTSVQPLHPGPGLHASIALPVSAELAAAFLSKRFAESESCGIEETLRYSVGYSSKSEEAAALLAGIPEVAACLGNIATLQAPAFVPHATRQLVAIASNTQYRDPRVISIASDVLSRFCTRGNSQLVASTMLGETRKAPGDLGTACAHLIAAMPPSSTALNKLMEYIVREASSGGVELVVLIPKEETWARRSDVRLALSDKLLTQRTLPTKSLVFLLSYLDAMSDSCIDVLADSAAKIAAFWGDQSAIQQVPAQQQGFLTEALALCLRLLGRSRFEFHSNLMPRVMKGISTRLQSSLPVVRVQALRIGKAMSEVLDPEKSPLFGDENLDLLPEEVWECVDEKSNMQNNGTRTSTHPDNKNQRRRRRGAQEKQSIRIRRENKVQDGGEPLTETDSDDNYGDDDDNEDAKRSIPLSSGSSSDSEFERYDLEESDDDDVEMSNLQLRDIVSKLQKADSCWKGQLQALRSAESLIRCQPDELAHYSQALARALLHSQVPGWIDEETHKGEDPVDEQRCRSLVALAVAVPEQVGVLLAGEFYSPSADTQVRCRALQSLAMAAQEMALPGSFLKSLKSGLLPFEAGAGGVGNNENRRNSPFNLALPADGRRVGRVVKRSERSLASTRSPRTHVNRFPEVALQWTSALLRECDVKRHGIDLFGRDHFLLGRLLCTLGSFLEACRHAPQAVPLAAATIELVNGRGVHDSDEPYVRRAALLAASQALSAIPPASIATAMLGTQEEIGGRSGAAALADRLRWLGEWVGDTADEDPDENCRAMATACKGLQHALATEALSSLELEPSPLLGPGGSVIHGRSDRLLLPASYAALSPRINVRLPLL